MLSSTAPAAKQAGSNDADQLDAAGEIILRLLHKAAGVAEANSQHAFEMAQKLSHQLRASEDRITELEAEVRIYQDRTGRAEQWLHKIYTDVEERLIKRPQEKRRDVLDSLGRRV